VYSDRQSLTQTYEKIKRFSIPILVLFYRKCTGGASDYELVKVFYTLDVAFVVIGSNGRFWEF
jgi:hypothetical protein